MTHEEKAINKNEGAPLTPIEARFQITEEKQ